MNLPSRRWTSFDGWDYNGMKERLQAALDNIDKPALLRHAERIKGQKVIMSEPFSAGQYWICFEMIAEDDSLVIARVRLPRHPEVPATVREEDEAYGIACEVATMEFVRQGLSAIPIPRLYAYEGPGSQLAADVGAAYMLLEGFYGNTLQDVEFDICNLPVATQEHIMMQWTTVQAELATLAYPQIGAVCSISPSGEPVIGSLAASSAAELRDAGPFSRAVEYFTAVANAAAGKLDSSTRLGALVFRDILGKTTLFGDIDTVEQFPLNHMDLGTQNIIVDDNFNFVAIIDWEFAQTAPWQVNRYPMPFPLLGPDTEDILRNPSHLAYKNVLRQDVSRRIYRQKFQEAERKLKEEGRALDGSFADTLNSSASRIYACFTSLGRLQQADRGLLREMVRLAFGFDADKVEEYLWKLEQGGELGGSG
ncbi:hypothetical protein N657DRAFT_651579 [Parathielavia appendiculata]|uniref:Aminoglycoside phosphotransferase domain-containing protein n=1 Tax=Parathielavia appendiculata TaxID=2587402 RepID=A0AAN6TPZ6_9PEZI|nr:hypothetical protein N657DRAFT_651579 [Parathielavia appendiculata]